MATTVTHPVAIRWSRPVYAASLAGVVALCALFLLLAYRHAIATWQVGDTDDLMRLQEVRDWMAGQSWFDVTQYRIDPPTGLPMHWSRLLDVPLAAVILLVRPFLGQGAAELGAAVVVPLATFAIIALLAAALARRLLADDRLALLAALFCTFDLGIYSIARPMRIDHHGWQAVCGLGMVLAILGPRTLRRTAIAGLLAAFWMHISLEGIVFTAGCGALLGLRWVASPETERAMPPVFLGHVALGSLVFFLIGHGGALFDRTACDAISPVHMTVFALAAAGTGLAAWRVPRTWFVRLAALGVTALLCGATYRLWAPQCAGGPFAALTPLTYRLWYLRVPEGLPVSAQGAIFAITWVAFPIVGLCGALVALRSERFSSSRAVVTDYAALLAIATVIGIVVSRASAFAGILAIPGALMLLVLGGAAATHIRWLPVRALAKASLFVALMPVTPAVAAQLMLVPDRPAHAGHGSTTDAPGDCIALSNVAHLDALPTGLFMTTLDTSEALIVATPHRAVGAGYHRNVAAMDDTIRFFIADDATAQAILRRHRANYVFVCPLDGDVAGLAKASPHGLAARLANGDAPAWLRPIAVPGLQAMKVYAVTG